MWSFTNPPDKVTLSPILVNSIALSKSAVKALIYSAFEATVFPSASPPKSAIAFCKSGIADVLIVLIATVLSLISFSTAGMITVLIVLIDSFKAISCATLSALSSSIYCLTAPK
jgi:hypothetical protein